MNFSFAVSCIVTNICHHEAVFGYIWVGNIYSVEKEKQNGCSTNEVVCINYIFVAQLYTSKMRYSVNRVFGYFLVLKLGDFESSQIVK